MTLWSKGIAAVAIGSSYLSEAKRDLILKTGIEEIVIATDNDKDGRKAKRSIIKRLSGFVDLQEIIWDGFERYYKDINEARNELDNVTIKDVDLFGWNE